MKRLIIFTAFLFFIFGLNAQTERDTLTHKAEFTGKNLFVKNVFSSRDGFTVKEVILNDRLLKERTDESVFEVNLKASGLKEGDEYTVKIVYQKDAGEPSILD